RAASIIQQEIIPRFRAGDMEGGVVQGTLALLGSIEGTYQPKPAARGRPSNDNLVTLLVILLIVFPFIMTRLFYSYGGARRGGWGYPMVIPGSGWGRRGGGWSGGSGGGFSGGGGSSGGGGASGGW
ncbi:MAG TPA: TPM domain-containing protein, partial [Allosphingosinicella sp.]|nr:TPM domain-containing protein [Allosphingosinicella sp.]